MTSSAERLDISLKMNEVCQKGRIKAERTETRFLNCQHFSISLTQSMAGMWLEFWTRIHMLLSSLNYCAILKLSEETEPLAEVSEHGFVTYMTHRNT